MPDDNTTNRLNLLEEHLRDISEKITPNSVSQNSYYSYRHANRLFKSFKGESIHSYATKIRMQTAAEYLKYSTESIFDIALIVGYESTAAFSKAFKKLYELAPSDFRQQEFFSNPSLPNTPTPYTIQYLDDFSVQVVKSWIDVDSYLKDYYEHVKTRFQQLNIDDSAWLILWDEDPELCKVSESRYYIGFYQQHADQYPNHLQTITLKGAYAVFDAAFLQEFPYDIWHEIAGLQLLLDNKTLREHYLIEWFSTSALQSLPTFTPNKISIPI